VSAWTDFRDKIASRKISLFEIDIPELHDFFLPEEAGIWMLKIRDYRKGVSGNFKNGAFCFGSFENSFSNQDLGWNDAAKTVGSVRVDNEDFTETTTLASCRSTEKSFFYDTDTILYIHFENWNPPHVFERIELGIVNGFATEDCYQNDVFYEGRVEVLPTITKTKDPLYFGLIRFGGGSVDLLNNDGFFDAFIEDTIFGQPCRIKFGGDDLAYADYYELFTGYVEDFTIDSTRFNCRIVDERKKLARNLPVNVFDTTTYPNLKTRNAGKAIPLAYGEITNAPVICTNEEEAGPPVNYSFKICDTTNHSIKEITTVYVEGVEKATAATSLVNATFDLANANYTAGDDVTVDFKGYDDSVAKDGSGTLIDNPLDIIEDLLEDYLDITYGADTFDTTEWAVAKAAAYNVALWIKKKKTIIACIEEMSLSVFGNFIVKGNGLYTFRLTDNIAAVKRTILRDEELTEPEAEYDSTEYLTSVVIGYDKDQDSGDYIEYTDSSRESDVYADYNTYREKEYETLLKDAADATALASTIMDEVEEIKPVFRVVSKTQAIDLEIMDNVSVQIDRKDSAWYGRNKCEVVGIGIDLDANRVDLSCRLIVAGEPDAIPEISEAIVEVAPISVGVSVA